MTSGELFLQFGNNLFVTLLRKRYLYSNDWGFLFGSRAIFISPLSLARSSQFQRNIPKT